MTILTNYFAIYLNLLDAIGFEYIRVPKRDRHTENRKAAKITIELDFLKPKIRRNWFNYTLRNIK